MNKLGSPFAYARTQSLAAWRFLVDSGLVFSLIILAFAVVGLSLWFLLLPNLGNDYRVEFVGFIYDIVFVLLLLAGFESWRSRRQDIKRQEEILEDYKRWDSEESHFRLAGAVRRLNRLGVTRLNLVGARLSDFSFADNQISDIEGTVFYDGTWGEPFKPNTVRLQRVEFDWVNCSNVQFSPFNPLGGLVPGASQFATFVDCTFLNSKLSGASCKGAGMVWTKPWAPDLFEYDEDGEGNPMAVQTVFGPFYGANLLSASFAGAHFERADFRGAENVSTADFSGATGLETCIFDTEDLRRDVQRKAKAHKA